MIKLCVECYLYGATDCVFLSDHLLIYSETHTRFDIKSIAYHWVHIQSKRVYDMIKTHNHTHHTDKYSQHSPIIWLFWLNVWVFVSDISGYWLGPLCSHLTYSKRICGKINAHNLNKVTQIK